MIKYCIFSIFCFLPFLIWADELPQLGKAPLEKVIQAMTVDEKIRLLTGTGEVAEDILVAVGETDKIVPGAAGTTYPIPRLGYSGDGNGPTVLPDFGFLPGVIVVREHFIVLLSL